MFDKNLEVYIDSVGLGLPLKIKYNNTHPTILVLITTNNLTQFIQFICTIYYSLNVRYK